MSRPLILVTNDDGILAPGLLALAEAVAPLGDVVVCAPESQPAGDWALPAPGPFTTVCAPLPGSSTKTL